MNTQPVYVAEYVEKRSRLTTFFRWILAIPHFIVLAVWGLVTYLAVVVAWFALLFTGRYPEGLYSFVCGFLRYATAVSGYVSLLTDQYPPFSSDTGGYPVRLVLPPAKAEYNRMKVLFRIILMIPVYIIAYAMNIVAQVGAIIAWFAIVILGRQPKGLQDMIVLGQSYNMRAYAYYGLVTEDWPSFTDQQGGSIEPGAGAAGAIGSAPERPAEPVGATPERSFAPPEAPGGEPTTPPSSTEPPASGGFSSGDPLNPGS